jgi:hypothetical protein
MWRSLPAVLTGATAFVAALTGLAAGLGQLRVFKRAQAPQTVAMVPAGQNTIRDQSAAPITGGSTSSAARVTTAQPPGPASPSRPATEAPAVPDTSAGESRLPKGTVLELEVPSRTCAPADGQRRFTARLAAPVRLNRATVLPVGTTAVLRIRRSQSSSAPQARLDSLVGPSLALAIPSSQVRSPRNATNGACLRTDARISATLSAPVGVPQE